MKLTREHIKYIIVSIVYLLWVIWLQNYWLLPGLVVIYDLYISKKVNWTFWKHKDKKKKNHFLIEWLDAIIFAVVAVTLINTFLFQNYKIPTGSMEKSLLVGDHLFVSKVSYGPRVPYTPLSFPFVQHTMPFSEKKPSFLTWIQWKHHRLKGTSQIKRNDVVVFNFPEGDTVVIQQQARSYYDILREVADKLKQQDKAEEKHILDNKMYEKQAREVIYSTYDVVYRPVDKTDNYIKRCVAIAGDTLEIKDGVVYTNGIKTDIVNDELQYNYYIRTNGQTINSKLLQRLGVSSDDIRFYLAYGILPLSEAKAQKIKELTIVLSVTRLVSPEKRFDVRIFPHSEDYPWNEDNFGPLYIPQAGATVSLNMKNLPIYKRIIDIYENNNLEVKDGTIYINGELANEYTFKFNYYWMMGDNRHHSSDARYWGFVPQTHIVGKPMFIWLSLNKDKNFVNSIRWSRMFSTIK